MHTPGPWRFFGPDKSEIRGPKGNTIAECFGYSDKATDPAQRAQGGRESNARLIAACPDMLSALTAIVERLEAWAEYSERIARTEADSPRAEQHNNIAANYRDLIRIARESMPV